MGMKAAELMRLTQGTKTLTEYLHDFNNLSKYAPGFVDTEEKKIESFKRGLGTKLMKTMANSRCLIYNEFIYDALTRRTRTTYTQQQRTAKEHLRQVPQDHLSPKLLW